MKTKPSWENNLLPLVAIVIGAILVRFVGLARESFWNDEAFTGYAAQLPTLGDVFHFISFDVHPPGYFAFIWGWARIFGMSDYALRASSAVAGVCLVPVTYRIGRQLFDPKTGLVAAVLAAFLFQSIYYSQELRAYIFLALFSAISFSLLIDCLRDLAENKRQPVLRYICLLLYCGLNGYFHYFGLLFSVLVAATLVIYAFYFQRQRKIALLFGFGFLAMYLPWAPVVLRSVGKTSWMEKPTVRFVFESVNVFYGAGWVMDLIAVLLILGAYASFFRRQKRFELFSGDRWLLGWILVPLLISVIISVLLRPVYSPRNLLLASVPAWLLLARALTLLPLRKIPVAVPLIALLVVQHTLQITIGRGYFVRPTKQQLREAANYISSHNPERLPIYAIDWDHENYAYYLSYTGQKDLIVGLSRLDVLKNGLATYIPNKRCWIASGGINVADTTDLKRDFRILDHARFYLADVYLLERKG